jgi:hypothetical protein
MDESSLDFKVLPAEESHAEELAKLYIEGYGGKYPLEEFTNPDLVRRAIRERRYCWMVGMHSGRIIASSAGIDAGWNNSFEHGRAIVYPPEFRRNHVIQALISTVVSVCLNQGHDIGWFGMRDGKGIGFSEKNDMGLVGFLPGMHKVKARETHLMYVVREGAYRTKRATNDCVSERYGACVKYVEDVLGLRRFGLCPPSEEYPPDVVVGGCDSSVAGYPGFKVWYELEKIDNAVCIGRIETAGGRLDALVDILGQEPFSAADYVQLDVLADKFDAHDLLKSLGFEICAFIPAWFLKGSKRYDCMRFVKHSQSESLGEEVESKVALLRTVYAPL